MVAASAAAMHLAEEAADSAAGPADLAAVVRMAVALAVITAAARAAIMVPGVAITAAGAITAAVIVAMAGTAADCTLATVRRTRMLPATTVAADTTMRGDIGIPIRPAMHHIPTDIDRTYLISSVTDRTTCLPDGPSAVTSS